MTCVDQVWLVELEFAVKCKKPIIIVRDFETEIPDVIPDDWKKFEGLLKSSRVQKFYVYYLTEFATKLQQIRKHPKIEDHPICFFDPSSPG